MFSMSSPGSHSPLLRELMRRRHEGHKNASKVFCVRTEQLSRMDKRKGSRGGSGPQQKFKTS